MKAWVPAVCALALLGCSGHDKKSLSEPGLQTMGMLGMPSPALEAANLLLVDATLNGKQGARLLVDTGSPYTLVNIAYFPGANLPARTQVAADVGIGSLTIDAVPVVQETGSTMDALRLGGILGGNALRDFPTTFNYREQELVIGKGAAVTNVGSPTNVGFKLSGGATGTLNGQIVEAPATRIPIDVVIEGVSHPFILDTGASEVSVRSSVFNPLLSDGRKSLDGFPVSTVYGPSTATVTRARSISLSGESVANVAVMTFDDSSLDSLLDSLGAEIGHSIDGLLGGDFLREFLLTIDYPNQVVELQRYATRDHIVDEFQRVGIVLGPSTTGYAVAVVYAGSDAEAKGIAVGDEVLAVDGQTLATLDEIQADSALVGSAGAAHTLAFGETSSAALRQASASIQIDDLLPAPN